MSDRSVATAATSGSVSSPENGRGLMDSPDEKKFATPPFTYKQFGSSNAGNGVPQLVRRNSGSLPDLRKAEQNTTTQDTSTLMSPFGGREGCEEVSTGMSDHVGKPLDELPEEGTGAFPLSVNTPPTSLQMSDNQSSLLTRTVAHAMDIAAGPASLGVISPTGPSSLASSTQSNSTVQSMELHIAQPLLYSAIGSLENSTGSFQNNYKKSSGREFRTSEPAHLIPPPRTQKNRLNNAFNSKPKPKSTGGAKASQSDRLGSASTTKSALRQKPDAASSTKIKSSMKKVDFGETGSGGSGGKKKLRKKGKRVTINQQAEERFLPVSEAFTPRHKKDLKYKPAEQRTPVQSMSSTMGTLSRPNFRDALRRVAMIILQHIVKIELRFANSTYNSNDLFSPIMKDMFSDDNYVTPRYKCTMVRVPMARPGTVYGMRKIPLDFSIPTEEEIYDFGEQLFKSVQLSSECSIVCLIYVERLMEVAKVPLVASTWRPIFMCGLLLASKVWQDLASWNIEFASVYPQYSLDAINRLELNFLRMVKWDLYISSR